MSGLASYNSAVSNFGSNQGSVKSFLDNYDSGYYTDYDSRLSDFKNAVASQSETGAKLVEAGEATESVAAGGIGTLHAYQNYNRIKKAQKKPKPKEKEKNDGDEEGKEEEMNTHPVSPREAGDEGVGEGEGSGVMDTPRDLADNILGEDEEQNLSDAIDAYQQTAVVDPETGNISYTGEPPNVALEDSTASGDTAAADASTSSAAEATASGTGCSARASGGL
jgi:hypothetical protein